MDGSEDKRQKAKTCPERSEGRVWLGHVGAAAYSRPVCQRAGSEHGAKKRSEADFFCGSKLFLG
jgi:hypothetical protein